VLCRGVQGFKKFEQVSLLQNGFSSSLTVGQNKLDRLLLASFFISFVEPEACGAGFGLASKY